MGDSTLLVAGLGAIFVALVVALSTIGVLTSERAQVSRSLAAVRDLQSAPDALRRDAEPSFQDRVVAPLLTRFTSAARRFTPSGQDERVRHRLELAGSPPRWDPDRVLAFKVLGLLVLGVLGLYIGSIYEETKGRPLYVIRETAGLDDVVDRESRARAARE
jgi:hypothetical protein